MQRSTFPAAFIVAFCLLLAGPVAAIAALTGESFCPNPPLVQGGSQHVNAQFYVIPSGSTTFNRGHVIQMQTTLQNAQWVIQVIVDGKNAARQTASGSAVFLNGALLSYPTNHDVSFTVTIDGIVPAAPDGQVLVLQADEIDNTGGVVPGSTISIVQPVDQQSPQYTPATTLPVMPAATPSLPMKPAQSAPGIVLPLGAMVAAAGMLVYRRSIAEHS